MVNIFYSTEVSSVVASDDSILQETGRLKVVMDRHDRHESICKLNLEGGDT